jgi:hypothetical protein
MSGSGDDTDSKVFLLLKHPIRRSILRILSASPKTFSELQNEFKIESSHVSYHLETLGNLLYRTPDGKYALSHLGETALSLMVDAEKPHATHTSHPIALKKNPRRYFKLGKFSIPMWPAVLLLIFVMSSAALAYYLMTAFTVPLEIKEPIEIVNYPTQWSLYPGETVNFTVTVVNHAPVNYFVVFNYQLNDSEYQTKYVQFSSQVYNVTPGQQDLPAWLTVASDAPAANALVTVNLTRTLLPVAGQASWWDRSWTYRKSHTILAQAGAATGYQIMVTVHYGSGLDSMGNVYCNGKCRSDFGDIRFTDSDGTTPLNYWMESKIDSDNAVFWVKIASDLSSQSATMYLYYGNGNASTTSSGDGTFLFFDDFLSPSIDSSRWNVVGSPSVAQSVCTIQYNETIYSKPTFGPYNVAFRARVLTNAAENNAVCTLGFEDVPHDNAAVFYVDNPADYGFIRGVNRNLGTQSSVDFSLFQDMNYRIWDVTWTGGQTSFQIDGVQTRSLASNVPSVAVPIEFHNRPGYDCTQNVDWVLVRQYVNPEPVQGTWSSEETFL